MYAYHIAWKTGDRDQLELARFHLNESLRMRGAVGEQPGFGSTIVHLASVNIAEHRYRDAFRDLKESLWMHKLMGGLRGIAFVLESFSILAAALHDHQRALVLEGAASSLRDLLGMPRSVMRHLELAHWLKQSRQLPEGARRVAELKGRVMTADQAAEWALELGEQIR